MTVDTLDVLAGTPYMVEVELVNDGYYEVTIRNTEAELLFSGDDDIVAEFTMDRKSTHNDLVTSVSRALHQHYPRIDGVYTAPEQEESEHDSE